MIISRMLRCLDPSPVMFEAVKVILINRRLRLHRVFATRIQSSVLLCFLAGTSMFYLATSTIWRAIVYAFLADDVFDRDQFLGVDWCPSLVFV